MKLLPLLLLVCCGRAPEVGVNIVVRGLSPADVSQIDVYILDSSNGPKTCTDIGLDTIAARTDVDVVSYKRVTPQERAQFVLGDGPWMIVAEAYGASDVGKMVAHHCSLAPPLYRDDTTRVTLVLEAVP